MKRTSQFFRTPPKIFRTFIDGYTVIYYICGHLYPPSPPPPPAASPIRRQALAKVTAEDVASFAAGMALAPARRSWNLGVGIGKRWETREKLGETLGKPWKITESHGKTWGTPWKSWGKWGEKWLNTDWTCCKRLEKYKTNWMWSIIHATWRWAVEELTGKRLGCTTERLGILQILGFHSPETLTVPICFFFHQISDRFQRTGWIPWGSPGKKTMESSLKSKSKLYLNNSSSYHFPQGFYCTSDPIYHFAIIFHMFLLGFPFSHPTLQPWKWWQAADGSLHRYVPAQEGSRVGWRIASNNLTWLWKNTNFNSQIHYKWTIVRIYMAMYDCVNLP